MENKKVKLTKIKDGWTNRTRVRVIAGVLLVAAVYSLLYWLVDHFEYNGY